MRPLFCALFLPLSLAFSFVGHAQYAEPLTEDSISAMLSQWHALPEASVETVGLAAGARGLDEVPGALHVISAAELERYVYTDPMRLLGTVSGVNIQEEDGYGLRPNIGLRGSGSERSARITLMEDGVLMAPAPYTAPAAYYFPSIARMSSIEVLKGSSQIAFGPQTAGGAINLVTTPLEGAASQLLYRSEISSYGGNLMHVRMMQEWSGKNGTWGALVEGMQLGSGGFKQLPGDQSTGFDKTDGIAKIRWTAAPERRLAQSIQLKVGFVEEESHETYAGLSEADFEANPLARYAASAQDVMHANQNQAVFRHEVKASERWQFETDVYRTRFHRNWYKLDGYLDSTETRISLSKLYATAQTNRLQEDTPNGEALLLKANNRWYGTQGIQHRGTLKFGSALSNQVVYGVRLHEDWVDRVQWRDAYRLNNGNMGLVEEGSPGSAGNRIDGARAFAGFIRSTLRFNNWTFTPGIRTERMEFYRQSYASYDPERTGASEDRSNAVSVWLPGIGVTYELPNADHAFLGIHRGFIPPGSAPNTRPESSINAELGYRWSRRHSAGQLVVFHNSYADLLGSDLTATGGLGTGDLFNGGSAQTSGVECEWAGELAPNAAHIAVPLRLTYTYTLARFTSAFESDFDPWSVVEEGDFLPYLAPHQGNAQVSFIRGNHALEINARFASSMRVEAGQASPEPSHATDALTVLDAMYRYQVSEECTAYVGVNNALNTAAVVAMRPAGLRPNMPRLFRAGISITL